MSEYENTERKPPSPDAPQLGTTAPSASDTSTEPNPHPSGNAALPDDQEPLGVGAAMFKGVANETEAYATDDDEAMIEAMNLGVEHEGIESSQLLGLLIATVVAIAVLVVTVYFTFIRGWVGENQARAEQIGQYTELANTRASGLALIGDYAVASPEEETFRIPVADAQRLIARRYALRQQGMSGLVQPPDQYALGGVTTTAAGSVVAAMSGQSISGTPLPDAAAQDLTEPDAVEPAEVGPDEAGLDATPSN